MEKENKIEELKDDTWKTVLAKIMFTTFFFIGFIYSIFYIINRISDYLFFNSPKQEEEQMTPGHNIEISGSESSEPTITVPLKEPYKTHVKEICSYRNEEEIERNCYYTEDTKDLPLSEAVQLLIDAQGYKYQEAEQVNKEAKLVR